MVDLTIDDVCDSAKCSNNSQQHNHLQDPGHQLHVQSPVPKNTMFQGWGSVMCVATEATHPFP